MKKFKRKRFFSVCLRSAFIVGLFLTNFFMLYSLAKYTSTVYGSFNASVASWTILVNTDDVAVHNTFTRDISFTVNSNPNVASGVMAPGSNGYFEILIDSNNVETAFDYDIVIGNIDDKPIGFSINSYQINSDANIDFSSGNISGVKLLDENNITSIKIYASWVNNEINNENDSSYDDSIISVPVQVTLTQRDLI